MSDEKKIYLTDSQINTIAELAAKKALENVYEKVGKNIIHKVIWFIGVGCIGFLMWLGEEGINLW